MENLTPAFEALIARFVAWAQTEDNIRAAVVIGSRARTDRPADNWSDLDMIILANDPEPYIAGTDWMRNFGEPKITFIEPTATGDELEHRALFEGGLDVDFVPVPIDGFRQMLRDGLSEMDKDIFRRGVRVLLDKEGLAEQVSVAEIGSPPNKPPLEADFLNTVNDFWYHTVWTAKKLRRGEVWMAKSCCDGYLKQLLLRMLRWHTKALQGWETDTWMSGRFVDFWIDSRAAKALATIFAHYDAEDIWRALQETMILYRWVAQETANALDYAYPASEDEYATEVVQTLFDGR